MELYSIFSNGACIKTVGKTLEMFPKDSFDFVPSKGYGTAQKLKEILEKEKKDHSKNVVRGSTKKEPHILFESSEEASEWAKTQLEHKFP
eukprot:11480087-Ditylum_brightwellii.AAC.1